jgi:hypothetical protein
VSRVVTLPREGRLLVVTDLQGNTRDFERVAALFEAASAEHEGRAVLVVTGDLVHGPEIPEDHWPDYLGTFYTGDSRRLLELASELQARHPGRVHYLLGNHEHAHIGGPVVSKFFADEAGRLEELLGPEGTARARAWLRTWPFLAVAPAAGLVMSHAAPHARLSSREDLEQISLDLGFDDPWAEGALGFSDDEQGFRSTLAALLWARTTSTERARRFLHAIEPGARVAVFGHDVARAGFAVDREPLLCVSTSFGCYDGDKLYLDWDLAEPATTAREVAERGLRPLYPDAERVYRS